MTTLKDNNMTGITVVTLKDGKERDIFTRNGYAYVLTGTDSNAAAELVPAEKLTEVQKSAAIGADDYDKTDLGKTLYEEAMENVGFEMGKKLFENMLINMAFELPAEMVWDEIMYAKANHNKFSKNFDPANVSVNADDLYCSAIARLVRKQFGEYVENIIHKTIAADDKSSFCNMFYTYRAILTDIIAENMLTTFDTWTKEEVRDYLTKMN